MQTRAADAKVSQRISSDIEIDGLFGRANDKMVPASTLTGNSMVANDVPPELREGTKLARLNKQQLAAIYPSIYESQHRAADSPFTTKASHNRQVH
jgi:hypothetical protein